MAVTITIPTALRQYASGNATMALDAATVGEALQGLIAAHPTLGQHLFGESGKLRSFVNVYVGEEDIRHLQGEATPVPAGETISIIPAIAGGSR